VENKRIEQIKSFLKDSPDDTFLNYALAIEYLGINEKELSKSIFENLLLKSPDYSATYYHYGKLLLSENRREEAKDIFEKGVQIALKNKETHAVAELRTILNELLYDED
jgi:tetratricopeptide (TPR) repeat protein